MKIIIEEMGNIEERNSCTDFLGQPVIIIGKMWSMPWYAMLQWAITLNLEALSLSLRVFPSADKEFHCLFFFKLWESKLNWELQKLVN